MTPEDLIAWQRAVSAQLADPSADPFVAAGGGVLVIGGTHTGDYDWCWCQEKMTMHGCGHWHGAHRRTMD